MSAALHRIVPHGRHHWGTHRAKLGRCTRISGVTSVGFDPDLAGIGSTACCGDQSMTGVAVPAAPTTECLNRYLIRLAAAVVPRDFGLAVVGLRQAVLLRAEVPNEDGSISPFELEVTSPFWRFPDGNVTFHLAWKQDQCGPLICDPDQQPATSPDVDCLDSGLLYVPPFIDGAGFPYVALNGGIAPGDGVVDLSAMRDLRYPWQHPDWTLSELQIGPGVVVLYASVWQTDPAKRPACNLTDAQVAVLRPEDQFVCRFPQARYGRVAGSIVYELFPCCDER